MRKLLSLSFALVLFVPLAACSGGEDEVNSGSSSASAEDDESTTTTEEEEDEGSDSEYCDVVDEVIELDDAFGDEDLDFSDDETIAIVINALEDLRDSVGDDDVADDYDVTIEGFEAITEAVEDAGGDEDAELEVFTDPEFQEQFTEFSEAGERIDEFTLEECGTTLDGSTETEDDLEESDDSIGSDGEDTSLEDFADDVEACEDGDMAVCDQLFAETPVDSEAETVGATCGGRSEERIPTQCEATFG